MRLCHSVNLALLFLYPVAWMAPLAHASVLPWFSGNQITVLGGIADLWDVDAVLAGLVLLFAVVIPYGKTLALAAMHRNWLRRGLRVVEALGKLSMADVFLVALYIVVVKGVGIGRVEPGWGLWLFTGCVLASIWVGWATRRSVRRNVSQSD